MGEPDPVKDHFDSIAETYKEEIPAHIREHLNAKWWNLVSSYLAPGCRVIDLGCGDGTNAAFLAAKQISAVGVDISRRLVLRGRQRYPELRGALFEGDVLNLQFPDGHFDAAVMTGVLHHIGSSKDQEKAILEALRVVREGGFLIVRESNLINPLFRLYWNYIFPLTNRIDRFGGENWIPARHIVRRFGNAVERIRFFTFIPNFTPRLLLPVSAFVEKILERSPLRKLSAHYLVVLRKQNIALMY
jgi:ubiquinone/menaquinone biosynthesis C-methylase UbiE